MVPESLLLLLLFILPVVGVTCALGRSSKWARVNKQRPTAEKRQSRRIPLVAAISGLQLALLVDSPRRSKSAAVEG